MELAVGKAHGFALAAEVEVRMLRVANRPAAIVVGERLNGLALARRYYEFCVLQGHNVKLSIVDIPKICADADYKQPPLHDGNGEQRSEIQGLRVVIARMTDDLALLQCPLRGAVGIREAC
jgi:hypothetical protein